MTNFRENFPNALSYDKVFYRVMADEEILKQFIQDLTGRTISSVSNVEYQKTITPEIKSKGIRADVYFEGDDTIYDIEMQKEEEPNLTRRVRVYQSVLDRNAIKMGRPYKELRNTMIIFVCNYDPVYKCLPIYKRYSCYEGLPDVEYNDGSSVYFINCKYFDDNMPLNIGIRELSQRVSGIMQTHNSNLGKLLDKRLDLILEEPEIQEDLIIMRMNEQRDQDIVAKRERNIREKAIAEGRAEGLAEGLAEGRVEGHAEGYAEGYAEVEGYLEQAICLLLKTTPAQEIASSVNKSIEYILQIAHKYNITPKDQSNNLPSSNSSINKLNLE